MNFQKIVSTFINKKMVVKKRPSWTHRCKEQIPPKVIGGNLISRRILKLTQPSAAAAKSLQSCLTLCDPIDGSPPGSPVPGTLQARTLEWVAISFSNAWTWKVKGKLLSRVRLFATPWTVAWDFPGKSTGVGCHCYPQCTSSLIIILYMSSTC